MKTLIIDDEFVSLMKLTSLLEDFGDCTHATHGKQSVELFNKAIMDQTPFNLIIIDIYLPDILGTKLLDYLNNKEKRSKIKQSKKIIITAKSSLKNVQEATKHNCDAFIVKPIKRDSFIQKLIDLGLVTGTKSNESIQEEEVQMDLSFSILDEAKLLEDEVKKEEEINNKRNKTVDKIENGVIVKEVIPPVIKEQLKQKIKEEKQDLFKMCNSDRIMMRYFDAIIEETIEERWNEQKTSNPD